MAKATTSKTESLTIRVPIDLINQWRDAAKKAGVSVAALVIDLAKRGMRLSVHPIVPPSKPVPLPPPLRAIRGDPAMKAVEPLDIEAAKRNAIRRALDDPKPVASLLPLTGTEFPARPVYLRGQDPGKGKR